MSLVQKLAERLKAFDRRVWPDHRVPLSPSLEKLLKEHNLIVADVGSAGGPQEMWLGIERFVHFVTFEPNPRPGEEGPGGGNVTNFQMGLWSSRTRRELHLTGNPDSSSLFPINLPLYADFVCKEGMEMTGSTMIELDTMDHLLEGRPGLQPDFIKSDVEGADLEVLKGARQALSRSVLGLRVETALEPQQIGAPALWETDAFLRAQGFVIFHYSNSYWIRANGMHGYSSAPQLTCGDGVYFLTKPKLLERLADRTEAERRVILAKFVVLLLRHGVHDYAWDLVVAAQKAGYVSAAFADDLRGVIKAALDKSIWYFVKGALGVVFALAVLAVSLPSAAARKRGVYYLKQRAGRFAYDVWRLASTTGRDHSAWIYDSSV